MLHFTTGRHTPRPLSAAAFKPQGTPADQHRSRSAAGRLPRTESRPWHSLRREGWRGFGGSAVLLPALLGAVLLTATPQSAQAIGIAAPPAKDATPPTLSGVTTSQNRLWPPNHKMRDVRLIYTATDNGTSPQELTYGIRVTSDEPVIGTGDGKRDYDWEIISPTLVRLRAERAGGGDGRIYTITVTCTDKSGNTTVRTATVSVPKSPGK